MSTYAIKNFHSDLERLKHFGGTSKETAIRFALQEFLDEYAKAKDLTLIPEVSIKNKAGKTVTPDGTLKDILRLDHDYQGIPKETWEYRLGSRSTLEWI